MKYQVEVEPGYEMLFEELVECLNQAQYGKGKKRHACGEPFHEQTIMQTANAHGIGFLTGQAEKKLRESNRLEYMPRIAERRGAVNYALAANIKDGLDWTKAVDQIFATPTPMPVVDYRLDCNCREPVPSPSGKQCLNCGMSIVQPSEESMPRGQGESSDKPDTRGDDMQSPGMP
jgi:hypothetical protein